MKPLRILLVNDSSLVRQLVIQLFAETAGIEIAATAANGELALRQLARQPFDLVLLDYEMPVLDGLQTLEILRRDYPNLPVIMLSRYTYQGATVTVDALMRGAADYQTLPDKAAVDDCARALLYKDLLAKIQRVRPAAGLTPPAAVVPQAPAIRRGQPQVGLLALGSSTGGPRVLEQILHALPADTHVPVLVVQHIAPAFVAALAESLQRKCSLRVGVASHNQVLSPGEIWLAPGERHLSLRRSGTELLLQCEDGPPENSCRPAVDVLFRAAAEHFGPAALCVVLTGMGNDGLEGARAVRAKGGHVLVQDQASSVVWGMPGAIAQAGLADQVLDPAQLVSEILHRIQLSQHGRARHG